MGGRLAWNGKGRGGRERFRPLEGPNRRKMINEVWKVLHYAEEEEEVDWGIHRILEGGNFQKIEGRSSYGSLCNDKRANFTLIE